LLFYSSTLLLFYSSTLLLFYSSTLLLFYFRFLLPQPPYAVAAFATPRACFATHARRISSRCASTYFFASSKFLYSRVPLIMLHGRQHATRFPASFFPFRARGTTKSTDITSAFSKLVFPSNPQYLQQN